MTGHSLDTSAQFAAAGSQMRVQGVRKATMQAALRAVVAATVGLLLLAPIAAADTCCANTAVEIEPRSANPGDVVRVNGITCLNADNTPGAVFKPERFWFWPGSRAAEGAPDVVPGEGLPQDLPPVDTWPSFTSAIKPASGPAIAVLSVPELSEGTYQLWWWCDGGGPGGGIHYSTGPRLVVGMPDTSTVEPAAAQGQANGGGWTVPSVLAIAGIGALLFLGLDTVSARVRRRRNSKP